MDPRLYIYKASAGSGKTFTLTVEYIKLLIRNPNNYRHILAVTFTNKATAEMKTRILSQLYGISKKLPTSGDYLRKISQELKKSPQDVCERAEQALNLLIHDYNNFHVETIDSFFQKVMKNMARELGLGANLNIDLDSKGALDEAVDSMLKKLTHDSQVLQWILDHALEEMGEGKNWNVIGGIKRFGMKIFDEAFIERGGRLRQKLAEHPEAMTDYIQKVRALQNEMKNVLPGFSGQFFSLMEENGIPAEKGFCNTNIVSYFHKLEGKDIYKKKDSDVKNNTVNKCLQEAEAWTVKSAQMREEMIALAQKDLIPLLRDAETFRPRCVRLVNTCDLALNNLSNLRLLTYIDGEMQELNRKKNRFLLANTNALLQSIISDSDSSFIFEKIGANIRYVMIDEFQDTSRMQFGNFRILLQEGLSQGFDSMVVGDVKQSIYRWRNGDWGILNSLNESNTDFPVNVKTLDTNFRSEQRIIAFNNVFFPTAVKCLDNQFVADFGMECAPLKSAYADVVQVSSHQEMDGYVKVRILKTDKDRKRDELMLEELDSTLTELLYKRRINPEDVAVLLRGNDDIAAIADYFHEKKPDLPLASDEAFLLSASEAVNLLVDALSVLDDETNALAIASLVMRYQKGVLCNEGDMNTYLLEDDKSPFLPSEYVEHYDELREMPLYELCERLYRIFGLDRLKNEDAYLFAFFDMITDYLNEHSSDLTSFLTEWNDNLYRKAIPSGEVKGVRLLTIHKSKGLQFHTVIVPYCDWKLQSSANVWCTPKEEPFNGLDLLPVVFDSRMSLSQFDTDYREEVIQQWVDNMNLLYVAFTRAEKNLFTIGMIPASKDNINNVAKLMWNALNDGLIESDTAFTYESGFVSPSVQKKNERQDNRLINPNVPLNVHMCSYSRDIEFRQSNQSADFIRRQEDEEENQGNYIQQGKLLHRIFSEIESTEDVAPLLVRLKMEGFFSSAFTLDKIEQIVNRALEQPLARDWFSGAWTLFNERSIVFRTTDGLEKRRPDRVMIKDGKVVVVDFKFGRPKEEYEEQVRGYMKLLSDMGYKEVEGYLWYVYADKFVTVK